MTRFYTVAGILISLVCAGQAQGLSGQSCLSYEPVVVELTGIIVSRTYPGPPDYESIRHGDEPENYWFLKLSRPVCVSQVNPKDLINLSKTNIRRIQLVFDGEEAYQRYARLLGRKVLATGTLYGSFTGHHHTPVLLSVFNLEKVRRIKRTSDAVFTQRPKTQHSVWIGGVAMNSICQQRIGKPWY